MSIRPGRAVEDEITGTGDDLVAGEAVAASPLADGQVDGEQAVTGEGELPGQPDLVQRVAVLPNGLLLAGARRAVRRDNPLVT